MIIIKSLNVNFKRKIAGFDLDYTLIKPKSGKKFPIDHSDWVWLYPEVKEKLINISKDYQIVIFSNQLGISKNKTSKEELEEKFKQIEKDINIPLIFLIADNDDKYRKPRIGSWKYIIKKGGIKEGSFYVGDAAGRYNDFNDTDRKFANNIRIPFYTPEYYFLKQKELPMSYKGYQLDNNFYQKYLMLPGYKKSIIIISGLPASGKSYLSNKIVEKLNYSYVSKDSDKSKFDINLKKHLNEGNNLIVEGLFYSDQQRQKIIKLANQYDYKKILIKVTTDLDLCYHLNYYRFIKGEKELVSKIVYNTYKKYLQPENKDDFNLIIEYHPNIGKKINKYFLY